MYNGIIIVNGFLSLAVDVQCTLCKGVVDFVGSMPVPKSSPRSATPICINCTRKGREISHLKTGVYTEVFIGPFTCYF